MKYLKTDIFQRLKPLHYFGGLLAGAAISNILWLYFLQWPTITVKRIVLILGVYALAALVCALLFSFFPQKRVRSIRLWGLIFSFAFSSILLFSLHIVLPSNVLFTPVSLLEIQPAAGSTALNDKEIVINYMRTELADVAYGSEISFNQFTWEDGWVRAGSKLRGDASIKTAAVWQGRAGAFAQISMQTGPDAGIVEITWNGYSQEFDLSAELSGNAVIDFDFPKTLLDRWSGWLSLWLLVSAGLYGLLMAFAALPEMKTRSPESKVWPLFVLVPLIAWLIFLLAFWPGILSQDSIDQWGQMLRFQIESWHSPFHTLTIWLFTRIWPAPAAVLVAQITVMALGLAWGLRQLVEMGAPKWIAAIISFLFALSPVNGIMMVTLWKDIPYSIALFVLTIQVIKIVNSDGNWLKRWPNWLGLGLSSMMIGLYRHNGIAVALVVILALLVVYHKRWRQLLYAGVVFGAGILFVLGPLYTLLEVDRQKGYSNVAFLYQIGAHYDQGTFFQEPELDYLEHLLPMQEWKTKYNPCTVNPILFHEQFNLNNFLYEDTRTPRELFLKLLLRNPVVNLRHFLSSGSLVWEIHPSCYLYYSSLDYYETDQPPYEQVKWVMKNDLGLQEASILPGAAAFLFDVFHESKDNWLLWRPAVYLYWILFVCVALGLRFRSWKVLLLAMPVLAQSGILMGVNIAQDFRYQFGVVLVGILFIGLLFVKSVEK